MSYDDPRLQERRMTARDELHDLIWTASDEQEAAEAVLAAGYRKPRTITTVEELDTLPVGAVVLSDAYRYMMHGGVDCGWAVSFQRWAGGDWHRGGRSSSTHPDNFLPATVLYAPEESA